MLSKITDQLSRPIRDLRISVIDRCNFRCRYCMPKEEYSKNYSFIDQNQWLSFDEIERAAKAFVNFGVTKLRLTGGEPLLRPKLSELIKRLSKIEGLQDLALTTNGSHLEEYAEELRACGLQRLTVSLDALQTKVFHAMTGGKGSIEAVLRGIEKAESVGFKSIKINVVIQKGINDGSIIDLVEHFRNTNHILRFIEYMDVGTCNHWSLTNVVPSKEIFQKINTQYPLQPVSAEYYGEVANRYHYVDGRGEIGFISSVTQPFCQSCTRARLSPEGKVYTCLFAQDGIDIKPFLAKDTQSALQDKLLSIWKNRSDRYSEKRNELLTKEKQRQKIEMFHIGG